MALPAGESRTVTQQHGVETLVHIPRSVCIGHIAGVVVVSWHADLNAEAIEALNCVLSRMQSRGGPIYGLHRLNNAINPLDTEVRKRSAQLTARFNPHTEAFGVVIEHGGFVGSLIHSALTGMIMASGRKVPFRSFRSMPPAATWISAKVAAREGRVVAPETLMAAMTHLTELLEGAAPGEP